MNRLRFGHIQRPCFFLVGDEDTVTHGNDWLGLLANPPLAAGSPLPYSGSATWPDINARQITHYWAIVGRTCHGEIGGDPFALPGEATRTREYLPDAAQFMLAHVDAQRSFVAVDPGGVGFPRNCGKHPSLQEHEPWDDKLFARKATRAGSGGTLIGAATPAQFQRNGHGTWLGVGESLKVARAQESDDRDSIYVGSADGVITRFQKTTKATVEPLEAVARSNVNGVDHTFGYGVFALAVGELGTAGAKKVVAGAYRRLAIYDAVTLNLESTVELDWERTGPMRIQIVDLVVGPPGNEIMLRTLHGHVLVLDGALALLADIHENSLQDILAVPGVPTTIASSKLTTPIFGLSTRGHILKLEMDTSGQQYLTGMSPLQYGTGWDLEAVSTGGGTRLAALYSGHPNGAGSIRLFDPLNLDMTAAFADVGNPMTAEGDTLPGAPGVVNATEGCLAIIPGGTPAYVTLLSDYVGVTDTSGLYLDYKRISTLPPAAGATCLQVGDVDPSTAGTEIVVSTLGGKVVWFKRTELETTAPLPTHSMATVTGQVWVDRCNTSLAGTWAMCLGRNGKLQGVDRAGTWWEVDPVNGQVSFVRDTLAKDTRGLADAGLPSNGLASGLGGSPHEFYWDTTSGTGATNRWLFTTPYGRWTNPLSGVQAYGVVPLSAFWGIPLIDGYWLSGAGIDVAHAGAIRYVAFWSQSEYPNLAQRFRLDTSFNPARGVDLWSSTGHDPGGGQRPPRQLPNRYLRTEQRSLTTFNLQSVRVGHVLKTATNPDDRQTVVSGMGGVVTVLEDSTGAKACVSDDFGLGGAAMALADLTGDGFDDVVFAPAYNARVAGGTATSSAALRSRLYVLTHDTAQNRLAVVHQVQLEESATDVAGTFACGIAVAALDPSAPATKHIIVTTMNGELLIFPWNQSAQQIGSRVWSGIVEGAIGGYNSIVVGDLSPANGTKQEIYVAGTMGVRRFDVQ